MGHADCKWVVWLDHGPGRRLAPSTDHSLRGDLWTHEVGLSHTRGFSSRLRGRHSFGPREVVAPLADIVPESVFGVDVQVYRLGMSCGIGNGAVYAKPVRSTLDVRSTRAVNEADVGADDSDTDDCASKSARTWRSGELSGKSLQSVASTDDSALEI